MEWKVFGVIDLTKECIIKEISELDRMDEESNLEDDKKLEIRELFKELKVINHRQKQILR